jgi:peptidoglycan/xylan/chitin deacetylase (PgdA/CDA1 family)
MTGCTVFLSVNFDAEAYDLKSTSEDRLYGRFSYGRYGVRAGLPRLLAMLERRSIQATVFAAASDVRRHPDAIRALRDAGHEIAARGADLTSLPLLKERERESLLEARDVLSGIVGEAPKGFRAPTGELSPRTLHFLAELGSRTTLRSRTMTIRMCSRWKEMRGSPRFRRRRRSTIRCRSLRATRMRA